MNGAFSASEVLGAMITPAVLISASGTLVLSTSNRLTRVVDRVRSLAGEAEELRKGETSDEAQKRAALIVEQIPLLSTRALLLRSALTAFYSAIGLLVTTSIAVGVSRRSGGITAGCRWSAAWPEAARCSTAASS